MANGKIDEPTPKRRRPKIGRLFIIVFLLGGYLYASYVQPLPLTKPAVQEVAALPAKQVNLDWPEIGESAIGSPGYGVLATHGDNKPMPTASIAKVLTALAVMKQHPLLKGQQGPSITITANDVATYQRFLAQQGSVVEVQLGEKLTEYEALQALLLPSANNIADLLAVWAFGSIGQYTQFANSFAKSLGLNDTTVADASGFSEKTTSTAHDLVLLGENVMDNPVLAEIVGQPQAEIPVAGTIYNVNLLVGHQEVVGIKTGNTDEAGGCFLVAARHRIDSKHEIVVIAVTLGAENLSTAINNTLPLLKSAYENFSVETIVNANTVIGSYKPAWGGSVSLTTAQPLTGVVWRPAPPKAQITLQPLKLNRTSEVPNPGSVDVYFGRKKVSTPLKTTEIPPASIGWRLTHPLR